MVSFTPKGKSQTHTYFSKQLFLKKNVFAEPKIGLCICGKRSSLDVADAFTNWNLWQPEGDASMISSWRRHTGTDWNFGSTTAFGAPLRLCVTGVTKTSNPKAFISWTLTILVVLYAKIVCKMLVAKKWFDALTLFDQKCFSNKKVAVVYL